MKNIWRLIKLIPEYRWRIVAVTALSTALGLAAIAVPYLIKLIIDQVTAVIKTPDTANAYQSIALLLGLLLGVRLIMLVAQYFQDRFSDYLFVDTMVSLRKRLYSHLLTLSIDYYEKTRAGEIIQRYTVGIMDVNRWIYNLASNGLVTLLSMVFIIGLLFRSDPLVGLIMLIVVPINLAIIIRRIRTTKPMRKEWLGFGEQAGGIMTESITHISTVRSFSSEAALDKVFSGIQQNFRTSRLRHLSLVWRSDFWAGLVGLIGVISSMAIVVYGALKGTKSVGDVYLVLQLSNNLLGSLNPLSRLISDTGDVESSAERITALLDIEPTVREASPALHLETIESITFEHVSFNYPGKKRKILDDVSFELPAGQVLALVGPSGTGKTTVTKLLMRFYDPSDGRILINGRDIREYAQASLRGLMGVVLQDVALFNDTIEQNIGFARPEATSKQIREAAQVAHADRFIDQLAEKYKTLVGERGVKLSGGEKQRVAIARAVLKDPQLIILDEATSALDSESEQFVQAGLRELMAGKTAVVIAHRLSTVMNADQILVFKNGKIVERGTHTNLTKKKAGLYAKLYHLQTDQKPKR